MARYVKVVPPDSFAAKLRGLQRERGLTNDELAREAGIGVRLIAKYRNGETEPRDYFGEPTENARKLATALGLPLDELLPTLEEAA